MAEKKKGFDLAAALGSVSNLDTGIEGREQIEYIRIDHLHQDERNFYELPGIPELAANIEFAGLQQPIRVRPDPEKEGHYIIVSGHRRHAALSQLVQEGSEKFAQVPCIVEKQSGAADEVEGWLQELRLIYGNSDTRRMSSADISKQAERVEMLLYQLKEAGVEFPGKMRDHVAEACKVSASKLGRLKVIRENLIDDLKKDWEKGDLSESVAYAFAKQAPEVQRLTVSSMVAITFKKMSAGHRFLKLQALTYGITRTFDSEECFNIDLCQDTDLLSDAVSVNTLDFTLMNKSAINFLFQRRQLLQAKYGNELLGVYYISTHSKSGKRYDIHAVDLVGLAEMAGNHQGGIYTGIRAEDLVAEILGDSIPWVMDADLKDVLLYGYLAATGKRENLRQVAFALCAMVVTGHRSYIEITRQKSVLAGTFPDVKSYENGAVESGALVTAVRVTAHSYTLGDSVTTLYKCLW